MAIPKIKATYSLDVETVAALERVARRWGVSKSEALRRAIRTSDGAGAVPDANASNAPDPRLAAFRRLQAMMNLDRAQADVWIADIRAERDASPAGHRYRPADRPGDRPADD